jgi:hypothetical protein
MNCFSRSTLLICLFCCAACDAPASEPGPGKAPTTYDVHYKIAPDPASGTAVVEMSVHQPLGQLIELSFSIDDIAISDLVADGELDVRNDRVTWRPERKGGSLRWRIAISHRRGNNGYDALLGAGWGIFRAEDIIPRARTRTLKNAFSRTKVTFDLPAGWTVASEYSRLKGQNFVLHAETRFDQPRGWIAMGKLGIRRETIADTKVTVAAPEGQMARRMDMLALLNWILPELLRVLPDSIPRLTIVSAGDPMWRGGLSAPASIFIHSSRPLISENATSTLAHEVFHVALGVTSEPGFDWIVEGLAEYYSLELLLRGGAITPRRYDEALQKQVRWSGNAEKLCSSRSSGATTALAVVIFRELDKELREKSAGKLSLDDVVAGIARTRSRVSLKTLDVLVDGLLHDTADALHDDSLAECRNDQSASGA